MILCARFAPRVPTRGAGAARAARAGRGPHARSSRRCRPTARSPTCGGAETYFGQDARRARRASCGCAPSPTSAWTAPSGWRPTRCWPGWPRGTPDPATTARCRRPDGVERSSRTRPVRRPARRRPPRPPAPSARTDSTPSGGSPHAPPPPLQRILGASAGPRTPRTRPRHRPHARRPERRRPLRSPPNAPSPATSWTRYAQRRALLSLAEELGARLRGAGPGVPLPQPHRALRRPVHHHPHPHACTSHSAHSPALPPAYALHAALGLQRAGSAASRCAPRASTPAELAAHQLTFDPADEQARRIEAVADRARARFGPRAIIPGSLSDAA